MHPAVRHIMNQPRTPASIRAADTEDVHARTFIGKHIEYDPQDGHGIRCGVVTGIARYDEGANRIGALMFTVKYDDKEGSFAPLFSSRDWKVID